MIWQARYYDGKTASAIEASVQISPQGLSITLPTQTLFWPYSEIVQTQGHYVGEPVRLEHTKQVGEILVVADERFLDTLHRRFPEVVGHFHQPALRKFRLVWIPGLFLFALFCVFVLYYWGIPKAAKHLAQKVPPGLETEWGLRLMAGLTADEVVCDDPLLQQNLQRIMERLQATEPKQTYSFQVKVVQGEHSNAFALPGGPIIIYSGLIQGAEGPEEVAGVLAHEMQHIKLRHATQSLLRGFGFSILVTSITGNVESVNQVLETLVETVGILQYSRGQEEEADQAGMEMILQAKIDPGGMIHFFESLEAIEPSGTAGKLLAFLSTHPTSHERVGLLKVQAGQAHFPPMTLKTPWPELKKRCQKNDDP